jgi:hypothetical protein
MVEKIAYEMGYRVTEKGNVISMINKERKLDLNKHGYYRFSIKINKNSVRACMVHRLVAFQKFGEKIYEEGIEVRHKNNIRTDNSYDNILIGSHSQNMLDLPKEDRQKYAEYATSFIRKYDKKEVQAYHSISRSYKDTKEHFGIKSSGTLHYVLNH